MDGIEVASVLALSGVTDPSTLSIPINNYIIRDGDSVVLLDAGAGNTMQASSGKLFGNLKAAGVSGAEVTHLLLSHLHPDHANGVLDEAGKAAFPNATLFVSDVEIDFWLGEPVANEPHWVTSNRARTRLNLDAYKDRITRVREGDEVAGLTALLAGGHTPGHMMWSGKIGNESFVIWGDLVHLASVQLPHPDVSVIYDIDPNAAAVSRKRYCDMLAHERPLILGAHIENGGMGYVRRKGNAYAFENL
jgi:glyoxylase-like metal-dependent hydrolase (beta-lactamase superfamily II)